MAGFGDRLSALEPRVAEYRENAAGHGRAGEICLMRLVGIGSYQPRSEMPGRLDQVIDVVWTERSSAEPYPEVG